MYIDHVTIHVPQGVLAGATGVFSFFEMLNFQEVDPEEAPEGLAVRWFQPKETPMMPLVHLVEGHVPDDFTKYGLFDQPVLGHFAIATSQEHMDYIEEFSRANGWLERNSGSGRFWLRFANIRVEVRHESSTPDRHHAR